MHSNEGERGIYTKLNLTYLGSSQENCHICAWFLPGVLELSVNLVVGEVYYPSNSALTIQSISEGL